MPRSLRLAFMGTPEFAVPSLEVLLERPGELLAVYTQPDRPRGRGLHLEMSPVKKRAVEAGIEVRQPATLKDDEAYTAFTALDLDACLVAAYGKILAVRYLEAPRLGCLNVHASLLPGYRGAAPIQWAIARGETETGITLMQMDAGMDTGDILLRRPIPIENDDTGATLHDKLAQLGAEVLCEGLAHLRDGFPLQPTPQDDSLATSAPLLKKADGRIDWSRPAAEIRNLTRAMNPWPGAFTKHGGRLLKIYRAARAPLHRPAEPGTVTLVHRTTPSRLEVACGDDTIELLDLQAEGRKRLEVGDFLGGYRIAEGDRLGE